MAEEQKSTLSASELEAEDVLADAEPWESFETKLVLWSWGIAAVVLVIGLIFVPTSILH